MNYNVVFAQDFIELDARYKGVENYIKLIAQGNVRSLIVNGPPGVGKSFAVKEYLDVYCPYDYKTVSGHMTLLSLYAALYHYKGRNRVLVLDDVDSVFKSIEGLNLLKSAMDTRPVRNIHWESTAAVLNTLGLPQSFNFEGGVILITNVGFGGTVHKMMSHLTALKDRSFCVPIADSGEDSCFKQLAFMVLHRKLLKDYQFTPQEELDLLDYIEANRRRLYTVSLRTIVKLADIYSFDKTTWKAVADQGMLKAIA
jgi:hypothetical protein